MKNYICEDLSEKYLKKKVKNIYPIFYFIFISDESIPNVFLYLSITKLYLVHFLYLPITNTYCMFVYLYLSITNICPKFLIIFIRDKFVLGLFYIYR